mgnify:FL=1
MPYPRIFRRLFANEGAGPLLRKDIIPCGTTAETVCQGDDSRLTGAVTDIAAMKANIATLEAIRKSWIGVPRWWRSTTLPANHVWADGSLVLFEDWPELEEVYNAGGFDGMLLEAGVDAETIAVNLGKWVKHPNGLGLYTPQLGNQFFRAWTLEAGREAGSYQGDAIRNLNGSVGNTLRGGVITDTGVFVSHQATYVIRAQDGGALPIYVEGFNFYAAEQVSTAPENRPANVAVPVILYLGLPA